MTLNRAFALVVGLIIYGSLYPFDFMWVPWDANAQNSLLHLDLSSPRWGDNMSNIALFLPFGWLGMGLAVRQEKATIWFLLLALAGMALAFGLQVAQLYLPNRFPSMVDVMSNSLGIFLGALLFLPFRPENWLTVSDLTATQKSAGILIGAWILDSLWPLIPALDVQLLKDSMKPLFLHPSMNPLGLLYHGVTWMVILHLLEHVWKRPWKIMWQIGLVATMFGLEIIMEANALHWDKVLGAMVALAVWNLGILNIRWRSLILATLLLLVVGWKGFTPLMWQEIPRSFHWMPLAATIMGQPLHSLSVLIQKCFLYGSLAWLLVERGKSLVAALILAVGSLMVIEVGQMYVSNHTPEITDPLMGLLFVLAFQSLWQEEALSRQYDVVGYNTRTTSV